MSEDGSNQDETLKHDKSFPTAAWVVPNRTEDDRPPPNTFELGLVMAGAVSCGAYTAGVIDVLVEALDDWEKAKADGRDDVPKHDVRIRVIAGTSAGGMTTAILAAWAHRKFPHVRKKKDGTSGRNEVEVEVGNKTIKKYEDVKGNERTGNPFFDAWVNRIDVSKLLALKERNPKNPPVSVLNGDILEDIVADVLNDAGKALPKPRAWFGQTTRVILTATNLRGIPYWEPIRGLSEDGYGMNNGRDYQTFALAQNDDELTAHDDEIRLLTGAIGSNLKTWGALGDWARATGAFPIALPPVQLVHKPDELAYRVIARDYAQPDMDVYVRAQPFTEATKTDDLSFLAVDGGVLNNEPLSLARQVLAGGAGRNPREGSKANRAILLIDPFPEFKAKLPPKEDAGALWTVARALIGTWKGTARFNPEDLAFAKDTSVFSRFLIAPTRSDRKKALAGGAILGFSGFLDREYRLHDYLLGRRNAQRMLTHHLVLPDTNPLFKGPEYGDPKTYHPIIPIVPDSSLATDQGRPAWPAMDKVDVDAVARKLSERVDAVIQRSLKSANLNGLERLAVNLFGRSLLKKKVRKATQAYVSKKLQAWDDQEEEE